MADQPPPNVPGSPQQVGLNPFPAAPAGPAIVGTVQLTIGMIHATQINREKMSDYHHKVRGKMFPYVVGCFVRCRVEDSPDGKPVYKVGRIKQLRPDWMIELDLLTSDEIKSGKNNTNYDCVSNAKLSEQEFNTFVSKLSPEIIPGIILNTARVEERIKLFESVILTESSGSGAPAQNPNKQQSPTADVNYIFSTNVLVLGDDTDSTRTITLQELLTNAIGPKGVSDPDTPRLQGGGAARAKTFDEAVASNSTMVQLSALQGYMNSPSAPPLDPTRLIKILKSSTNATHTAFTYDNLPEFHKTVMSVCANAKQIMSGEPLYPRIKSPSIVFGDIHGNYADMMFFLDKVIAFDDITLKYMSTNLLFLGDYVDRGVHGLECIMYLLALKCLAPSKVTLLRGNHESPEVNGDMDVYGYSSFKYQCLDRFGRDKGLEVWMAVNEVFQYMPVIANIDNKIFCVHGGLPQYCGGDDRRLEILDDPNFPRLPVIQCADPSNVAQRMIVNDLLWSDPAGPNSLLDKYGFGPNPRGPDIKTFGARAVDMFCERYGFQYIFRAHQEKADGLRVSDSARVVTIFSTSDYAGHQNGAGCVLVANGKLRMAIKKPNVPQDTTPRLTSPSKRTSPKKF